MTCWWTEPWDLSSWTGEDGREGGQRVRPYSKRPFGLTGRIKGHPQNPTPWLNPPTTPSLSTFSYPHPPPLTCDVKSPNLGPLFNSCQPSAQRVRSCALLLLYVDHSDSSALDSSAPPDSLVPNFSLVSAVVSIVLHQWSPHRSTTWISVSANLPTRLHRVSSRRALWILYSIRELNFCILLRSNSLRYSLPRVPGSLVWQTLRHFRLRWMCWILQGNWSSSILLHKFYFDLFSIRPIGNWLLIVFVLFSAFDSPESPVHLQGQEWGSLSGRQDSSQPVPCLPSPQMRRSWNEQRW